MNITGQMREEMNELRAKRNNLSKCLDFNKRTLFENSELLEVE